MDHMAGFQMPGMAAPSLINQPPQIFGGYTHDGMPLQHLPPDLTAQMFGDPNGLLDDANEAKRRRIARVSPGCSRTSTSLSQPVMRHMLTWSTHAGLRYVQEEEDQVRR